MPLSTAHKLLVVSVDAMHTDDIPFARTLPAFARILERASVAEIEGIYPSVTYPNHTAQTTGCPPARTGIFNNLQFQPGGGDASEWFWDARALRVPTIFEAAQQAGLTTAAVQWPVTGNAPGVDWLVPEIACPQVFDGLEDQYLSTTDARSFETYIAPHLSMIHTDRRKGKYFDFVNHVSELILRHERPDVMFVHLVEVDTARHAGGSYGPHVEEALREVDATLATYLTALEDNGDLEQTNIVLVSDHGHLDVEQHTNLNTLFVERGFIRTGADGELLDWDVFCLGAGLSGQLFLAEDLPVQRRREIEALLVEIESDPQYRIEKIWTAEETRRDYGLDGPFTWVVESEPGVIVGMLWDRRTVVRAGDEDFPPLKGSHGHAPRHGGQPVFIATGPDFAPGVDAGRRSMLDEAPTLAAVLGIELPDAEGVVMQEVLAEVPAATAPAPA
ncbi:alkaline phosphatase family protein [Ruania alba]|uniref:Predicted pyrophosphatase or phosphodiesterase, AlkP superfamily n=1 Tax=Ruania alba TaxID=648782 RepID=A0A1H5G8B7_9MICO|nr:alkaline phosphatase family protein [Ruania alba]SEE11860.1 Predicted pyrophosphatase or phosphodiesterase, AlkP superfamily [Ruania alba]